MAISGEGRRVLIVVENLPVPFDRRVWSEATTLVAHGYQVCVICPKGKDAQKSYELIDGVHIYRHPMPIEANGALGYALEYGSALFWEFLLAIRIKLTRGFDVIHACNPPDLIFVIAAFFKYLTRTRFLFDHHDINPELYEAKFGRRDFFWKMMVLFERWTFKLSDVSIATNESYKRIALERGGKSPDEVFVVRSGPNLRRVQEQAPDPAWKRGKAHLVAYIGVIGQQEGIDLLLESASYLVKERGRTDVQFVIMGGGPAVQSLKQQSAAMGLADYVEFTGRIDDATLFTVLSTADVCVNPDRPNAMNDKSTMNKIMEYMAVGKPIVQYDLTEGRFSAREASLYARNTDPADFGDKIAELLADPEKRAEMGRFGKRRVVDELAWPHEVPKLLQAYDAVFDAPQAAEGDVIEGAR